MISPGGKVHWLYPKCNSEYISPIIKMGQKSGQCGSRHSWWPWRTRIKEPPFRKTAARRKGKAQRLVRRANR